MPPTSLLLFTTSQTPLAIRYPAPARTRSLPIPPLLHASLHLAVDRAPAPPSFTRTDEGVLMIPDPEDKIDAINGNRAAVAEEQEGADGKEPDGDTEITVKFYIISDSPATASSSLPTTKTTTDTVQRQKQQITRALRNLQHYKAHDPRWRGDRARRGIDTFLIGWKGVEYRGERRSSVSGEPGKTVASAKLMSKLRADTEREEAARQKERERALGLSLDDEQKREIGEIWADLPNLVPQAKKLGTLSLPLPLLQYLASTPSPKPQKEPTPATVNSTGTPVSVAQSHEHEHEREKAEARDLEKAKGPSTRHVAVPAQDDGATHESTANETDKTLLAELIPPPSTTSTTTTTSLPNGSANPNGNGTAQANSAGKRTLPAVNCMNTPDCHWLPEELLQYAREQGIELWAGGAGESCDPLPSVHLHNTMQEFISKFPEGVFKQDTTLARLIPFSDEKGDDDDDDAQGNTEVGVNVEWVLGYTVISKSRNVVQDKGYIISAALL
ncbi:hypothetical protein QFC21_000196 [Naganishia friedmannii]|uniref:Uncharacterized protein n=1 Tax=Naganishia friedmannii TaxID=89922 RepID=A0ACC2WBU0_9TREE|nr:hypothetical protein QFC21_000196 [Naganishia friedmannii]